ncbi:MAG: hypothetical protein OXC53_07910 [Rhodobacteraceae bacterium]|nr:hypothetical protein [Paracoccaceae bacterium]
MTILKPAGPHVLKFGLEVAPGLLSAWRERRATQERTEQCIKLQGQGFSEEFILAVFQKEDRRGSTSFDSAAIKDEIGRFDCAREGQTQKLKSGVSRAAGEAR